MIKSPMMQFYRNFRQIAFVQLKNIQERQEFAVIFDAQTNQNVRGPVMLRMYISTDPCPRLPAACACGQKGAFSIRLLTFPALE